jgi:hypothetical protein
MTNRHFAAGAGLEKARTAPYRAKHLIIESCYSVYNQRELFICLDLIFKNSEVSIERYFKRWTSTKLVWARY